MKTSITIISLLAPFALWMWTHPDTSHHSPTEASDKAIMKFVAEAKAPAPMPTITYAPKPTVRYRTSTKVEELEDTISSLKSEVEQLRNQIR